jgi:hypothetical protein
MIPTEFLFKVSLKLSSPIPRFPSTLPLSQDSPRFQSNFPTQTTNQSHPTFQGLVVAGLNDLRRPADQLSVGQSASLAATGIIWSRYSLVIIPKNYALFSVNVFVALTQVIQLYRAFTFEKKVKAISAVPEASK